VWERRKPRCVITSFCSEKVIWADWPTLTLKRVSYSQLVLLLRRIQTMNPTKVENEQADDEILTYEVSDSELETSSGLSLLRGGAVTLAFCSGLDTCQA
jgi:hypothetical protein